MPSLFTVRLEMPDGDIINEHLIILIGLKKCNPDELAEIIESEVNQELSPDALTVLTPFGKIKGMQEILENDLAVETALNRLRASTNVYVAGIGSDGLAKKVIKVRGSGNAPCPNLEEFYRPAITTLFGIRGGFVEATKSYHFVNPSGRHTNRFLRLSNLLVKGSDVHLLAQACLRFIPEDTSTVWIDTPSLFSIVSAVNEYRSLFGQNRVQIECFQSYQGFKTIPNSPKSNKDVVLISASSSGSLASKIESRQGMPKDRLVHVLYLGKKSPHYPCIANLISADPENLVGVDILPKTMEADSCTHCQEGSSVVYLKGEQFDIRGPQPTPVLIEKKDAPKALSTVAGRFAGYKCLGLNASGSRERHFFIDADELCENSDFQKRLDYILSAKITSSVTHIIQVDEWSEKFCNLIKAHLEAHGVVVEITSASEVDSIKHNGTIVIAASVVESGRCLTDISRDLRNIAPETPLIYIVGAEKNSGLGRRKRLEGTLIQCAHPVKHTYQAVETWVLPTSNKRNAWSLELELLLEPDHHEFFQGDLDSWRLERIAELKELASLRDKLFLPRNDMNRLTLQKGFVFWSKSTTKADAHSEVDVFYTIASILQNLRAKSESPTNDNVLRNIWFHQTIIAPENFSRFNDDIIQAAFLRAAQKSELNYRETPEASNTLCRTLLRIVESSEKDRSGAAPEFMLALATGQLGLCKKDSDAVLEAAIKQTGLVRAFAQIANFRNSDSI